MIRWSAGLATTQNVPTTGMNPIITKNELWFANVYLPAPAQLTNMILRLVLHVDTNHLYLMTMQGCEIVVLLL